MTKNLLKQIMLKPEEKKSSVDTDSLIKKIEEGYTVNRVAKHQQKKTFAPSTIAYGHGECPRYWYLAFEGNTFEDNTDAYGAANMTSGTMSHDRIQKAMLDSGIAKQFLDDDGNPTTEFKVTNSKPPIFGWGDAMLEWNGEELLTEIKTMPNDAYEYFKAAGKPKKGHVVQLLIYMKIFKKAKGIMLYENKNNHELNAFVIEINDVYKKWVEYAFGWLNTVRQAWEDKTLPRKNYRANSKICKNCPLQKACATEEVGSIKIESLEALSEIV